MYLSDSQRLEMKGSRCQESKIYPSDSVLEKKSMKWT